MSNLDIGNAALSNQRTIVEDYSIPLMSTDGVKDGDESAYQNNSWTEQWGYFNANPDLRSALLLNSTWNVGEGFTCNADTRVVMDHWSGFGKDTPEEIIYNMDLVSSLSGDSFAEIIRADDKNKTILNLKPLDPSSIKIVVDSSGRIIRYEQTAKLGGKTQFKKWNPEEIFHLPCNRLADEIHGRGYVDVLKKTIQADEESFEDNRKIMHRQARPLIMFKLKTDDPAKIAAFAAKMDQATKYGENIYIPDDENTVEYDIVQITPSAIVDTWRSDVRNRFFRAISMPQIVPGGGGQSTESEAKTIYAAYERVVRKRQLFLEKQILKQLNLKVKFVPPASMLPNLEADTAKDGAMGMKPNDTNARSSE